MWISSDPLREQFPNVSSYVYCHDNPIRFIDPTGMADGEPDKVQVVTDAGHGIDGTNNSAVDPGACDGSEYEKDYALMIEKQVSSWLNKWDVNSSRTREGDITIDENSLNYGWKFANEEGAEVFVSFHLDGTTSSDVIGVYQQGKSNEAESKKLGEYIFENLTLMEPADNYLVPVKGHTRFNTLGVLNNFKGKAGLLIELGGIRSEDNRSNIKTNASEIGRQIATGIYQYLNNGNSPNRQEFKPIDILKMWLKPEPAFNPFSFKY